MEEWRPIKRSKGQYEVSNLGRVRNVRTGKFRTLHSSQCGSKIVHLGGWINCTCSVAQLVIEGFYGYKPRRIKHINGIVTDDRLENIFVEEDYE